MAVPSRSLKPLLTGSSSDWGEDAVYSEHENTRVVRTPKWAYFKRFSDAPNHPIGDELFDVERDPFETSNLIADPACSEIRATLDDMLTRFFATHTRSAADLWAGGAPKQNSERMEFWRDAWGDDWEPVYRYGDS
jgi:hypothetical protein